MNPIQNLLRLATVYRDFSKRRAICRGLPVRLWIETSSLCNLACPMCNNRDLPATEKQHMGMALFTRIIDQAKSFAHDVNLHHRGEPLLNPDFPEMIRYAKQSGLGVRFHTNATLLDPEYAARILAAGPDLVSVSFDGFEKQAYESIRKGAQFEQTVANIQGLLQQKQKTQAKTYVIIERIDFPDLKYPVQPAAAALKKRFQSLGADEIVTKALFAWPVDTDDTPSARPQQICTFPWYTMVILADGTVTACPQDYMARMRLGHAGQTPLTTIWNDAPYQELRRALANDIGSLPVCVNCDRLSRKQTGGVPFQYMIPFLLDMFAGYGPLRRRMGSFERNSRNRS